MMEDTATVETTPAEAQVVETESAPVEVSQAQAPEASKPNIKEILKRGEKDPNAVFTDAELDLVDKYNEQVESKGKPKSDPEPEVAEPAEKAEPEAKETPEEEEPAEEPDDEAAPPEIEAILKEVGAKSLKDAHAKIKDLRREISVKGSEAAKIAKERDEIVRSGQELWTALAKNDPQALAFVDKTFGFKPNAQQSNQQVQRSATSDYIDPEAFIDPDSAQQVNAVFQRQAEELKALKEKFGMIEQERDRHIQQAVEQQSIAQIVDEMAEIAQEIPELKSIPGFKDLAKAALSGKNDPRLEIFRELFDIAAKIQGATLKDAFYINRGRNINRIQAVAKQEGIKQAYNVKPNPSLSGHTGGKGETSYQPVTAAQLEKWESDPTTHPASWYDKDDNLVQSKIPKGAWKIFGFK